MRFFRRRPAKTELPTLASLVLRDGITTAVAKGATRERVPDIQRHPFLSPVDDIARSLVLLAREYEWSDDRLRTAVLARATPYPRCLACGQTEDHDLHTTAAR